MAQKWQSKLVLLAVLPWAGTQAVADCYWWAGHALPVAIWTIGLSSLLALITWKLRAATPAGAGAGLLITASLMFSTAVVPYQPWHTALVPTVAVALLAAAATRAGRGKKQQIGTAEASRGRSASQVSANLGVAMLAASSLAQGWLMELHWMPHRVIAQDLLFALVAAALAEAAADTVSSEIGQILGGRPRLITSLRAVDPGRDGAVSLAGSAAGLLAAALVAGSAVWALGGGWSMFWVGGTAAVCGFFFDSLLGASLEERGLLNNDAVNFLSTAGAAAIALALLAFVR